MARKKPFDDARAARRIEERFRRARAEREARWSAVSDAELQAMVLERSEQETADIGGRWFLPLLMDAVPRWATRHFTTDADARVRRAHELAEVLGYSQGAAAIADPDARASTKGTLTAVFNAIAEGLALGAYCPDGATFVGTNWQVQGSQLRVTNRQFCAVYPLDDPSYWESRQVTTLEVHA